VSQVTHHSLKRLSLNTMSRSRIAACLVFLASVASCLAQRAEPHNYDLLDVTWRLSYDTAARSIIGDITNTLTLKSAGDSVWFDCGPMRIHSVTVDGRETTSEFQNERLTVRLPRKGRVGQSIKVRIRYSGQPTAGIYFVSAEHAYPAKVGMVYTQGEAEDNRYWLPTYDFPDDRATAECYVDVPPGHFALSNGKLMGIEKKSSAWTYHWKISRPISTYLISLVAGEYSEGKEALGALPVLYYVPKGTEEWGKAAFSGTGKMIDVFNKLTGFNYPFEKFSQSAVADFMFGGMENASCVTQTIHALHKPSNKPLASADGLVAHELAHQWFGDTVTCADWSHAWLNEGFASFLPSFYFRKARGEDDFDANRYGTFAGALGSQQATKRPVVSNRYEVPMDLFDGQVYGGGAARLFTLMYQIGEKTFWQGVKLYLNEFKFKNVTTEDFFRVMSKVSKRDLNTFRDQFFYSSDMPEYRVSRSGSDVVIDQKAPGYDLDLKITFLGREAIAKQVPVRVHGTRTVVSAPGQEGNLAVLDYAMTAMVRIQYTDQFSADDLKRVYRLAPNAAAKLAAIDRFSNNLSEQDWLDMARSEKSRPVLAALIPRLSRNAVPYLVQLSRSFDRETAFAAENRLDAFSDDPQALDRLTEIWTRETNEIMRNTALRSLLKAAKDDRLSIEAWSMESQDEMFRVTVLNWWADKKPELARERSLSLLADAPVEPLRNEAIRVLGRLKDPPGEHRAFDVLLKIANEPSFASRSAAIEALVNFGDARAIPVIEPLTKSNLFFTRRAAVSAITRLKAKLKMDWKAGDGL
jgi:aminopeptidase N